MSSAFIQFIYLFFAAVFTCNGRYFAAPAKRASALMTMTIKGVEANKVFA